MIEMEHDYEVIGLCAICECGEVFVIPFDEIEDECQCEDCFEFEDDLISDEEMIDIMVMDEIQEVLMKLEYARENSDLESYKFWMSILEKLIEM